MGDERSLLDMEQLNFRRLSYFRLHIAIGLSQSIQLRRQGQVTYEIERYLDRLDQ